MKYDKDHINIILESLSNGDGRVRACKEANISYQCFINWIEEEVEFFESVKKAEIVGNKRIKDLQLRKIIEDKSWTSAAWYLERRFPNEFAKREFQEVKSENKNEITFGGIPIKKETLEKLEYDEA